MKEAAKFNGHHEKKEDIKMQLLEGGRYKKTTFARDIIKGKYNDDKFAEIFYLESVTYNSNDSGTKWQSIVLRDVTGRIEGRIWPENINPEYEKYTGTVVLVQGRYTVYGGKPDLTVDKMEEALYYEVSDYIETISGDSKKRAFDWIGKIMSYIEGPYKSLADELLPAERMEEIAGLPLSEKGAFSYIGGLLTYTSEAAVRTYYELRVASLVTCDISLALTAALLSRLAAAEMLVKRGIFFTTDICPGMAGGDFYTHKMLLDTQAFHTIDRRGRAELMHIFNAIAGKVPPGTVEAQLVKSAVENTLFIGSYKNDFTEHDKKYPCSMRQDIYSTSLDSRIYRIKENNQKKEVKNGTINEHGH